MQTKSLKLGQKIKRFRLVNDIRQEDMAEKMGVSRATLINYEKGHTVINVDVLNRLKNHYPDIDLDLDNKSKKIITNNTIDFKVLLDVLLDKKFFIIKFTFLIAIIGTSSSYLFKEYYNAEISFYPAKKEIDQNLGRLQSIASNFGVNTVESESNFNISDVVRSRLIANKIIKNKWIDKKQNTLSLIELWNLKKNSPVSFISKKNIDTLVVHEKAIKKLENYVNVREDQSSGLIRITTTFEDPVIAASIANFICSEVESYIQKENSAQSTKQKIFISERLLIVKNELEASEIDLKEFMERNRGYERSPELFMKYSQLLRQVETKKEVYLTLQNQLELVRIEEVKTSPILHILDSAVPPIKKSYPNRRLFLIISFLVGTIFSSLIVVFRN